MKTSINKCCKVKRKVKLSLCLINQALCHEEIWGSGGIAQPFLTMALEGVEWAASRPCRFPPQGKSPCYPLHRRLGLDTVEKRKIMHCQELNPGRPVRSLSLYQLSSLDSPTLQSNIHIWDTCCPGKCWYRALNRS
jgi:hypothetical protein